MLGKYMISKELSLKVSKYVDKLLVVKGLVKIGSTVLFFKNLRDYKARTI